jgi:hypothetical protein
MTPEQVFEQLAALIAEADGDAARVAEVPLSPWDWDGIEQYPVDEESDPKI